MDFTGLILNTLADGTIARKLQGKLASEKVKAEVFDTQGMKISHCIGCNHCFLKTPGVCAIKDDYEQILKKLAHSDMLWLVSDTHFGFRKEGNGSCSASAQHGLGVSRRRDATHSSLWQTERWIDILW